MPRLVNGHNLAVHERTGWQLLTSPGNVRELLREDSAPSGPERHFAFAPAAKATVAVKLYFLQPFLALRQVLGWSSIHGLNEFDLGSRQVGQVFRFHWSRARIAPPSPLVNDDPVLGGDLGMNGN